MLEKDTATVYFCHFCITLHTWCKRGSWYRSPVIEDDYLCLRGLVSRIAPTVRYSDARLVMNRQIYGPDHGLPLLKLEHQAMNTRHSYRFNNVASTQARVVDDKLLLHQVIPIDHSKGNSKKLRDHINLLGSIVCMRLSIHQTAGPWIPKQIPELVNGGSHPPFFVSCNQSFGSCPFCLTDYCIEISNRNGLKDFVVKIDVYCQLGDCRSPFD